MQPTDSGSLMHATLEEFMVRVGSALPEPDDAWDDPARQMLHAAFADHAADYEARGLTGRALLWARDQRDLAADLDEFLRDDAAHRAQYRTRRVFGELRFGMHEPFTVSLPDGRSLSLRGSIDRVDQTDAGAVVIDYKTGKDTKYRKLSAVDPLAGGTVLQLPIYALAARDALEIAGAIDAYYWFISRNKGGDRRGYTVDDDVVSALTNALGLIVSSIEAGIFVPRPGAPVYRVFNDCLSCDPDSLGTAEAYRLWRAKRSAPELAAYVDYIGADDD